MFWPFTYIMLITSRTAGISLAEKLQFQVIEWNDGYGLVDFETREILAPEQSFAESLAETMYNSKTANRKIYLLKNARFVLEGEGNRKNLSRLQQTILHIKKFNPGMSLIVYTDERRFVPDEIFYVDFPNPAERKKNFQNFFKTCPFG